MSEELIACFSMEIALHPAMPTYSGGRQTETSVKWVVEDFLHELP